MTFPNHKAEDEMEETSNVTEITKSKKPKKKKRLARTKHRMEIIRTFCGIGGFCVNLFILAHILGYW